jgi:EpsI family protein
VPDRRQFLFGGACLASAVAASALRPRNRLALLGTAKIEAVTPKKFGQWAEMPLGEVVLPRDDGSLSAQLYSQVLSRVYVNQGSQAIIMLALAYGDTQSDLLQLHRPENCYPAFGFQLSSFHRDRVPLPRAQSIGTSSMVASSPDRTEAVTYWTRLGEYLPTTQTEQRVDKLRTALAGTIPDGMLVRCSALGDSVDENFNVNRHFLKDLVLAIEPGHRPAFIGTALSRQLADVRLT